MTIKKKYILLKRQAKQAMIHGQLNYYIKLILEAEQLSVLFIKNKIVFL